MNNFGTAKNFIFLYSITMLGSLIGMISAFGVLNSHFQNGWVLPVALGFRTFFMFFSGKTGPKIFQRFKPKKTIILSELLGVLGVLSVLAGFAYGNMYLAVIGISFLGFPGGMLGQGIVAVAKNTLSNDEFTKVTANLSVLTGALIITAGIVSPMLVSEFDISSILLFDIGSYFVGILFLLPIKSVERASKEKPEESKNEGLGSFSIGKLYASLLPSLTLIGLLPLFSGDEAIRGQLGYENSKLLMAGWAFEGLGLILAGQLYKMKNLREANYLFFSLSALPLGLSLFFNNEILLFVSMVSLGCSYSFCFMKIRDDHMIKYGKTEAMSYAMSGKLVSARSIFCILSPLYIVFCLQFSSLRIFLVVLGISQLGLYLYIHLSTKFGLRTRSV